MDYVLKPIAVCEKFTLMEAVYWIAFSLPAVTPDDNPRERPWYEINNKVYNIFLEPRTYWPNYEIRKGGGKSSHSRTPQFPPSIPVQSVFFLRKKDVPVPIDFESSYSVINHVINSEDSEKVEAYREKYKQIVSNYNIQLDEHDRTFSFCVKKAKIELIDALLNSKVVAKGKL